MVEKIGVEYQRVKSTKFGHANWRVNPTALIVYNHVSLSGFVQMRDFSEVRRNWLVVVFYKCVTSPKSVGRY